MTSRYFSLSEYERRWAEIYRAMDSHGAEAAVVWGRSGGTYDRAGDILYLTNYYGNNSGQGYDNPYTHTRAFSAAVFRAGEPPELHVDDSWPRRDLIATDNIKVSRDPTGSVAASLRERKPSGKVLLCGSDFFPMKYWAELQEAAPGLEWQIVDDLVLKPRRIKSAPELEAMREAGAIASRAITGMVEAFLAGKAESEAAAEAARVVVAEGGAVHMIPCSHGALIENFVSYPLPGYSRSVPQQGDLVRAFVYGPMREGYYSDPGRTLVIGRPTPEQRRLVEECAHICDALTAAIRPGMPVAELASMGEKMLAEVGSVKDQAAEKFPIFGHGIGLFFEKPYISNVMGDPGEVFEENMVVGVEVFHGRKGVGSAGFEQNAIVGRDGTEVTTTAPMLWW